MSELQTTESKYDVDEKMEVLATELGLDIHTSLETRMDAAVKKTNQALRLVIEAGVCYTTVRAELPHGEFENWLNERGVSRQRASEAMKLAHISKTLPTKERQQLFSVSKTKALLIAKADKEIIDQLIEETSGGELKDLDQLSFRDMRDRIRKLEADKADLEVENETRAATIRNLNEQAAGARNFNQDFPDFVNVSRHEGNALSTEISMRLDELERHVNELIDMGSTAAPEMLSIAVTSLEIHLKALAARSYKIANHLNTNMGALVTELKSEHVLSDEEIESAIRDRNTMTQEMQQQQKIRDDERENAKPRKPGRPKKQ